MAAIPLTEAVNMETEMAGKVITIQDLLNVGPLQKTEEGQKFSELRQSFWKTVINSDKIPEVTDTEKILEVSASMAKNEDDVAWVWIAPWPADICTLLWLTKYLGKYPGRFFVVNIAGLPFLDEEGKLFFPKNISELLPREVIKAKRLARAVSYAEIETDGEDWRKLVEENALVRILEGGKKIISKEVNYYDKQLVSFCSQQFQKASRVVNQTMAKSETHTGDAFLGWRLRELAAQETLRLQGDTSKTLKDFEVKIPSGELDFDEATEIVSEN